MPLDFSGQGTPVQAGVLDFSGKGTPLDFSSGGTRVKKTREQVQAEVGAAQGRMDVVNPPEVQGWGGRMAGSELANNVASWLSLQPLMHGVGTALSIPLNQIAGELYGPRPKPFVINRDTGQLTQEVGEDPYFGAGKPMVNVPMASPEQMPDVSALPRVLAQVVQGLTTPENVATLPLAAGKGVGGQLAATVFAPQMVTSGLQSAPGIVTGETPQAREEAAYNTAINLLLGGKIGKGLVDQYTPRPIVPEVMPPLQRPVAPTGLQLKAPELPFTEAEFATPPRLPAPGERPTMPTGSPLDRPAGAARFGVDVTGKAVDISQLSPKEQVELYRGPKEFVPREQYVRPAQQAPVIIGGEKQAEVKPVFQNETRPVRPVFVPSRPPVEPSGGEISFRAPAEAQGIPSARQSVVQPEVKVEEPKAPVVFQNETAPAVPVKPTVAKMATSKNLNPLGDPMGTTYYGTPEDLAAYQGAQAKLKAIRENDPTMDKPESFTQMQEVMKENERVKNKYGGMPPQAQAASAAPSGGGMGGGMARAIEKNKEGGSVPNPFPFIVEKFKKKEKEKRGDTFALSGPRIALDPKESGFKDVTKKVDAQQLWNRVKNKLTPAEKDIYEKSGVDKKIVELGKVSPEEAAEMLQEGGVEVQTHSYGMEGKVSEAKKEYDRMTHEWYDNLDETPQLVVDQLNRATIEKKSTTAYVDRLRQLGVDVSKAQQYAELKATTYHEPKDTSPRATSYYSTVSALDTTQPMPEWTTTKGGKNVQRVDVVVPHNPDLSKAERVERQKNNDFNIKRNVLWQPDNLHENLPNTLGWSMVQYLPETPDGKRIALLAEGQSRWGQEHRKQLDQIKVENKPATFGDETKPWVVSHQNRTGFGGSGERATSRFATEQEAQQYANTLKQKMGDATGHPLLRDYNRLILKATIDQVRKEGATHIMLSDAETAMMTEGHDLHGRKYVKGLLTREAAEQLVKESPNKKYVIEPDSGEKGRWKVIDYGVEQEPGMRLNYDKTYWTLRDKEGKFVKEAGPWKSEQEALASAKEGQTPIERPGVLHGIAEELTGSKGERVSVGEHKNAVRVSEISVFADGKGKWDVTNQDTGETVSIADYKEALELAKSLRKSSPRSNLIFKNPDGTPKTDVSGTLYPLPKTDKKFSVFEKDRPEQVEGRLYMNPVGPVAKQAVKDITTLGKKVKETGEDFIRTYAEPLQEQIGRLGGPVGKKVSEEAGQIISRGKELYGELTPVIDPAKKQVGKMMREGTTWMRGRNEVTPFASFNNFFGVNEGAVTTPLHAKRGIKLAADANLAIGKMAERANPGFKASGKLQRIPTTVGYDFIVNGGEGRNRWIEGVAKLNNKPVQEVQNFFDKMKQTLGDPSSDAASLDRINQDFTRKFPRTITHIKTATGWHEVVVSDPFNYLEQAAQRTAHSVAFREVYPLIQHNGQWVQSGKLQATRKAIMKELDKGSDIVKFDNLVKALQGHPLDTFKGGATTAIGAVSGTIGSPLKALMLSANAPVNIGEVLSGGPSIFMGYTTMGKAVGRMLTDNTFYDQLELTGARNKAMYNMALDPSSPMRSVARQVATGVRTLTGQQFLNEIQETTAAASAKVYSDAIKGGKMGEYSLNRAKALFRAMGFNEGQATKMVNGDVELLKQFENRAASWLTTGNQTTAEMSRLGASRLFNAAFWFHKYPQMTLNQFRSVGGNWIDDVHAYAKNPSKASWSPLYHNSVLMGRLLGGRTLQGAITLGILAGVSGGLYGIYQTMREAEEESLKFAGDSLVSGFGGPLSVMQRLNQNVKGGESFTKELVKLSAPASINQELVDMGMGVGRYTGMGKMESIATFLESKTPISRTIRMGLAVSGLSEKDLELEVAMKAFYKWRKEQPGFVPMGQMGGTEDQVEIRSGMQKVKKAIEAGEDWVSELKKVKETKGAGASLRAGTMLQVNGKPLDAEQIKSLEKRLGANGLEKIKLRDAMLREVGRELNEKTESGEKQAPQGIKKPTGKWAVDYETDSVRSERVMGKLEPKVREFLKKNEVDGVGYTPSLRRGDKRQQLTMEQVKVLEDEYVEQVNRLVENLAKNKSLEERTPKLRKTLISNMLEGARKIAMAKSLGKIPRDQEQQERSE